MAKIVEVKGDHQFVEIYTEIKSDIESTLKAFREVWEKSGNNEMFSELAFCLFTPQSKAKSCWAAVEMLVGNNLILKGSPEQIAAKINTVRFRNNKAGYLVEARQRFIDNNVSIKETLKAQDTPEKMREWLHRNIKGMGMKEATHFLRNIGFGEDLAILDRHILRNLAAAKVIPEIPKSIPTKKYIAIENSMRDYAHSLGMPLAHLDIVMWYKETGEIFK